ncbi:MAG: tetratricopeptide repeat protein [Chloroflexi bacterium]|nr:tetratricopeptide repeat protein [Chloroflexota bacterium]
MTVATLAPPIEDKKSFEQFIPYSELDRLLLLLEHGRQGVWIFCLYNTVAVREAVTEVLREQLEALPVYEFSLSEDQPNPLAYLEQLPEDARADPCVIVFHGVESAMGQGFDRYLETYREQFMALPHSLVFWVRQGAWQRLIRHAPNFYARNAGIFDFRVHIPEHLQTRSITASAPLEWKDAQDMERLEQLYTNLLAEYERDREPAKDMMADLLGKLGFIHYFKGDVIEAIDHCRKALTIAREIGDRWAENAYLGNLGNAYYSLGRVQQAIEYYRQALEISREIGDHSREANVLKALGDLALRQARLDDAQKHYQRALHIYASIGERVGQADLLKVLGDLAVKKADS